MLEHVLDIPLDANRLFVIQYNFSLTLRSISWFVLSYHYDIHLDLHELYENIELLCKAKIVFVVKHFSLLVIAYHSLLCRFLEQASSIKYYIQSK